MRDRIDELECECEARYRRERLALYRARAYGDRPTSATRLRELERASNQAEERLRLVRATSGGEAGAGKREQVHDEGGAG